MKSTWIVWIVCLHLGYSQGTSEENEEYGHLIFGDVETMEPGLPLISSFNAITNPELLWTDNTVYYDIDSDYTDDQLLAIDLALTDLINALKVNDEKCVDIVKIDREDPEAPENYAFVQKYSGCSSFVGMIGGSQRISLVDSCVDRHGTIQHEFIHAMGFYHEHQRSDRDDYVEINYDNIQTGTRSNFFKTSGATLLNQTYDYGSVMHYSNTSFAIDDSIETIKVLDPEAEIGQRLNVSSQDVLDIQLLYGCISVDTVMPELSWSDLFTPLTWEDDQPI